MTIASTVNRDTYVGTGSVGPFAYGFRIFAASDLLVVKRDLAGLETTLTYPGDFTVTGVGERSGGTISLTTALATGYTLSIRRVRPLTQGTELRNQGPYFPQTIEDAFDNATMVDQQLEDAIERSVRMPESIAPSAFDPTLPATLTPGSALVVNPAGTGFSMAAMTAAQLSAWNAAQNMKLDAFTSGHGDFTPGVTTTLTLSAAPGNVGNTTVTRRTSGSVVVYETDEYSISGTTLTFTSVIPASTTRVEVRYLFTYQVNTADAANVTYAPLSGSGTDVRTRLRSIDSRLAAVAIAITEAPYNADPTGVLDAASAFNAAAAAVAALGGGTVYLPAGTFLMDAADISVLRTVNVLGAGAGATFIRSTTGKALKLKGAGGWRHCIEHITFDGCHVLYGETNADFANGAAVVHCEVENCVTGIVYQHNFWLTVIHDTLIHDCTDGVLYDLATAATNAGAVLRISDSGIFNVQRGVVVNGNSADGHDIMISNSDIEHTSVACLQTVASGEGWIVLRDVHMELNTGYFIDNDGSHILLDGFWALSVTETAWVKSRSGTIFIKNGRADFSINKFATMIGGTVQVDPNSIFAAARWWGNGAIPMVTAGSSGGTIVSTRESYLAWNLASVGTLTNAAPGPMVLSTVNAYDANERVWEFDVDCTAAVAANNTLRVFLTNGTTSPIIDLLFPLVVGGIHVTVIWKPGASIQASGTYAPSAAAGNSQRVTGTVVDTSTMSETKVLTLETMNGGAGTKATMVITNFREYLSGPRQVAL